MTRPLPKGWCPGAHRPMMAADGLVVRIRPREGRLTRTQALGLCDLADAHASGAIALTNRANLQLRSVQPAAHETVLEALAWLDLLDADPSLEARRNIIVQPLWTPSDQTECIARSLAALLPNLPDLPAKIGFAVDTGPAPLLTEASADIRIERAGQGLLLRADGALTGRAVTEAELPGAILALSTWLAQHITPETRRMAPLAPLLPAKWQGTAPNPAAPQPKLGRHALGTLAAAAFGDLPAATLHAALKHATGLRITPWRQILLEGTATLPGMPGLITDPTDPLLRVDACPGAPHCASATVETRPLARPLAPRSTGTLHVSGCAKGCARARPADRTLVGRDGHFDVVEAGAAWDAPRQTGLTAAQLLD